MSPKDIHEDFRVRLRRLVHRVRQSLAVAQARYKRNYDKLVKTVCQALQVEDKVYEDTHDKERGKLG